MENDTLQHPKSHQKGSNYVKLIIPVSAKQDIQTVFRNAKFFPFKAADDKLIVSIPREENETLQQFLLEMEIPVELQDYKSPYLQYFMSREHEKLIDSEFKGVRQWPSKENPGVNVLSVHYRLNP